MDTRWRRFSHSTLVKVVGFIIAIVCFSAAVTTLAQTIESTQNDLGIVFEESYFLGQEYINESSQIVNNLENLTLKYKSEANILSGATLSADELKNQEDRLYDEFTSESRSYNPNLTEQENYRIFQQAYAVQLEEARQKRIQEHLRAYYSSLQSLEQQEGIIYYAKSGASVFTNSSDPSREYFQTFPSYLLIDGYQQMVRPEEIKDSQYYHRITSGTRDGELGLQDIVYVAFSEEFLNPRLAAWNEDKLTTTDNMKQIAAWLTGLLTALIYLAVVTGRRPEDYGKVELNWLDQLFTDVNIAAGISLVTVWAVSLVILIRAGSQQLLFPLTLAASALGLALLLSLVRHLKNGTFIKHSLLYVIFEKIFLFSRDVYDSGSTGVKVILLVIGYPLLVAATFFMFPITIGVAAWLALKKVQQFNLIKEGVKQVKEGEIHYVIDVSGDGELGRLAADINGITDGLNKAVANELRSERLKTELITNVSHDIRTPLTSIITYVDLLKNAPDGQKAAEYIEVIDQKAQRLRVMTEDLFEAAKASSGTMPVNFEKIDIVSLLTQGLGELDDKIKECGLDFKINHPQDKLFVTADGKLLWRALENLLSNIFKYALAGSRVYVDIEQWVGGVTLTIKNISAFELNISSEELLERFKRGDESRSSVGSGLGLSIAKSLIELQKGRFDIEIDGDLFKAIIHLPKAG